MKKTIAFISMAMLLLSSTISFAQSSDEKEIAARIESMRKALLSSDTKTLDQLTAPQLSYAHSTGVVEDKAMFIDNVSKGVVTYLSITFSDQTINVSGDAAVVRHRMVTELKNKTGPMTVDIIVLSVWQKQNGEWKLLARQGARLPVAK